MSTSDKASTDPIIIISAARSGSKFLRNVLAASSRIDAVPYDVNYIWRYGQNTDQHDRLSPSSLTAKRVRFIKENLNRLSALKPNNILLEKTVSNALRVPFVNAIYPNARFIHLLRDGRDVTISARQQWGARTNYLRLLQKLRGMPLNNFPYLYWILKNKFSDTSTPPIWGPRYPGLTTDHGLKTLNQICAAQWKSCFEHGSNDLEGISKSRVFTIRYEELLTNDLQLKRLISQFNLPDPQSIIQEYNNTVQHWKQSNWPKISSRSQAEIKNIISPSLIKLGYLS